MTAKQLHDELDALINAVRGSESITARASGTREDFRAIREQEGYVFEVRDRILREQFPDYEPRAEEVEAGQ